MTQVLEGPRVVAVIPGPSTGPSMIFCKRLVAGLQAAGLPVRPFFLASRTSPTVLAREWLRLRRELAEFKAELVHAQFGSMTALVCATATALPLVATFHGSDLNPAVADSWLRNTLGHLFSHLSALRARRIICVSHELKDRLSWCAGRVTVLPAGADPELFRPGPRDEAREELGWNGDDRVVLFYASQTPHAKRLDLAVAALESVRRRLPTARLEIVYGGVEPDRMPLLMKASDCLLVTSEREGMPTIVQEALVCNLPVISTDVGDVKRYLESVEWSRLVERDPEAIADALLSVLRQPRRSNGREVARGVHLPEIVTRTIELYREAVGYSAPRPSQAATRW
ncbi:MAG: glycosyltransferase [Candidatus Riflebacteria bacterium]|nr:glycosyltransferase [Candidatus Riflebacteria bacterium]